MSPRPYRSKVRADAAGETKARIIAAATDLLGATPYAPFSLESVARRTGITRLTVYNQFGSRRALLEAVFDQSALAAGMDRLGEAIATPDPHRALALIVERFCAFWSAGRQTHLRLHAARAVDPDLDEALHERNERRRRLLGVVVGRLAQRGDVQNESVPDLIDMLHVLTGLHVFADLAERREAGAARQLIWQMVENVLKRAATHTGAEPRETPSKR